MPRKIAQPTPEQLARRRYAREYARKKRQQQLAAANASATHCRRKQGTGVCGGRLEDRVVNGRVVTQCRACERRRQGICRDCPARVAGTVGVAIRCAACKRRSMQAAGRKHYRLHRDKILRADKQARDRLPAEVKAHKLMAKKLWRRANPEKVHAYKVAERERRREKIRAYHKARRARLRDQLAAKAREDYYRRRPQIALKPCRECGGEIVWAPPGRPKVRCDACVPPCIRARRRKVVPTGYVRPVVEVPLRTCVTKGCDIVVTHRTKKCPKCKAKHTATARMLLNAKVTATPSAHPVPRAVA